MAIASIISPVIIDNITAINKRITKGSKKLLINILKRLTFAFFGRIFNPYLFCLFITSFFVRPFLLVFNSFNTSSISLLKASIFNQPFLNFKNYT